MRYVLFYLRKVLMVAGAVAAGFVLAPRIGIWQTLLAFAVVAAVAVAVGGYLLKTSAVSQITWRNRVAGFLAPWGWTFANGKLGRAMIASWVVWVLLGTCGALLMSRAASSIGLSPNMVASSASSSPTVVTVLLALAWIVDGGALLYFFSTLAKNFSIRSRPALSIMKVMALCIAILLASVALFLNGHPYAALAFAGGPPLAVALIFGLFMTVILCAGKNVRWN